MAPGRRALEVIQQLPDDLVGVGDLPVVTIDVPIAEAGRGLAIVGFVRFEEVHPDEGPVGLLLGEEQLHLVQPGGGVGVFELHVLEVEVVALVGLQLVAVGEEDGRREERGGLPARLLQRNGQRVVGGLGGQPGQRRVVLPGQHRGDRERGVRRLGVGPFEADRPAGEGVDVRRGGARVAVGAHVVGAKRVDGDQHDVGVGPGGTRRSGAAGDGWRRRARRRARGGSGGHTAAPARAAPPRSAAPGAPDEEMRGCARAIECWRPRPPPPAGRQRPATPAVAAPLPMPVTER